MTEQMKVIGGVENFWLYSDQEGYDITHPMSPDAARVYPPMTPQTRDSRAIINPTKAALVVVDLQNYFLSPALGRPAKSLGLQVVDQLIHEAIPACRKAGIPVLWLGWGLTPEDIEAMPPTITCGFSMDTNFEGDRKAPELGADMGSVELHEGKKVDAGKALDLTLNTCITVDSCKSDCTKEVIQTRVAGWSKINVCAVKTCVAGQILVSSPFGTSVTTY